MASILDFFEMYGTWFIVGAVIIVLAIIGRYADKTNFGQNKEKENNQDNINNEELTNINVNEKVNNDEPIKDEVLEEKNELVNDLVQEESYTPIGLQNTEVELPIDNNKVKEQIQDEIKRENEYSFDDHYDALDEEINSLLPKKETISEDLLDDIDSLSLDKTQKIKISDIPDLDDVDLPEIKDLNQQDDDIWKF